MKIGIRHFVILLAGCTLLATGLSLKISHDATPKLEEARVEGGNYYIGNRFGKQDYKKIANAKVNSFFIMKTEVPFNVYETVRKWGGKHGYKLEDVCNGSIDEFCGTPDADGGRQPVVNVSWWGAIVFANALSAMSDLTPVYQDTLGSDIKDSAIGAGAGVNVKHNLSADGFRLPSYIEWQVAARGAQSALAEGKYGFANAGSDNLSEVAWHEKNAGRQTHPVGLKKANPLGLYDMSGNVSEWTDSFEDLYGGAEVPKKMGAYNLYYYCGDSVLMNQDSSLSCDVHSPNFKGLDTGFRLARNAR